LSRVGLTIPMRAKRSRIRGPPGETRQALCESRSRLDDLWALRYEYNNKDRRTQELWMGRRRGEPQQTVSSEGTTAGRHSQKGAGTKERRSSRQDEEEESNNYKMLYCSTIVQNKNLFRARGILPKTCKQHLLLPGVSGK